MKRLSNALIALAMILTVSAACVYARTDADLFASVASNDPSRIDLVKLEAWGFLPQGSTAGPLTRYDAASLILRAEKAAQEKGYLVVAQAEMDFSDGEEVVQHKDLAPGATPVTAGEEAASVAEGAVGLSPEEARKTFKTLKDAYDYELVRIQAEAKKVKEKAEKIEKQDFLLWKQVRSLSNNSMIALHGFGRATWTSARYFGTVSPHPFDRYPYASGRGMAFIDFDPTGTASKELKWNAVIRMSTDLTSGAAGNKLTAERITMRFDPPFLSAIAGDFDLSWTPLTVWNRSSLDKEYVPDVVARLDDYLKYPIFMNNGTDLPFRGLKFGTAVQWEKSPVLGSFKVDSFIHMLRSGFAGGYFANRYSGWIFGGMAELKAKKYFSMSGYGLIFDEPLDSDLPGSTYNPLDTITWAQKYTVTSLCPRLEASAGDLTFGVGYEVATSKYQDDKRNVDRVVTDWAAIGGPYLKWKESSLRVKTYNVGYAFYSPLAQLRQVNEYDRSLTTHPIKISGDPVNDALGRAGSLFKFYNRLTDNVLPYGDATPNRKGFGLETDIKAGPKKAFGLKGRFYSLKPIREDEAMNGSGTDVVPVENLVMDRKFTYINIGPRIDFGTLINTTRKIEFGFNVRSEKTGNVFGDLKGTSLDLGLTFGIKPNWDLGFALGTFHGSGVEMGFMGSTLARYPYRYDPTDAGAYLPFVVDQTSNYRALSTVFRLGNHSKLASDFILKSDEGVLGTTGTVKNQTLDVVYEVIF